MMESGLSLVLSTTPVVLALLTTLACSGQQPATSSPEGSTDTREALAPGASSPEGSECLDAASTLREAPTNVPDKIGVMHILVRHVELERPLGASLGREQACLRALEALVELQNGTSWSDAVEEYSDSGKSTGGDLGRVAADELDPAFAGAAFSLEVDQLSYVVETSRGFHVILRSE